ncbi:MAG: xanthine dehydrogenase family protein subunit M [Deltaproteobacteria bacterium]|nr:xanthine dehydrogenase family protein subunit M [Deltaproteobacteria bacterium]MBW2311247.1 xanthine dehydrogenase family protein subunit M [Deltaproteobacteria bacterium]RLB30666.1 MAG: xanthine dehydrogenase family protein subunit M [Deltaproteobacteria bacterium]
MMDYDYMKPASMKEVFTLLKEYGPKATLIAGGTDVMVNIRNRELSPEVLISLRGLHELRYIRKNDGYHIGALTTHRMLEQSDMVKGELSALHDAASQLGSVQVRNVATVGGNICNAAPSADTAGPLLALDATVVLEGPDGRRSVPIADFFTGPSKTVRKGDEVLVEFHIPEAPGRFGSAYWKHARRRAMDLPLLGLAVGLALSESREIFDARIGLTVAAPVPMRAHKAEEFLKGKPLEAEVLEEAGEIASSEASPRDSLRSKAWYRREMIAVFVPRMVRLAAERIRDK